MRASSAAKFSPSSLHTPTWAAARRAVRTVPGPPLNRLAGGSTCEMGDETAVPGQGPLLPRKAKLRSSVCLHPSRPGALAMCRSLRSPSVSRLRHPPASPARTNPNRGEGRTSGRPPPGGVTEQDRDPTRRDNKQQRGGGRGNQERGLGFAALALARRSPTVRQSGGDTLTAQ